MLASAAIDELRQWAMDFGQPFLQHGTPAIRIREKNLATMTMVVHWLLALLGVAGLAFLGKRGLLARWQLWLLLPAAVAFEWLAFRVAFPGQPFWDFTQCYYPAGQAALHHDVAALTALYQRVVQGFVNMPVVAWVFAPFALLGAGAATALYTAAGIVAAAWAWHLLARAAALDRTGRWILALLFLANGPLLDGIKFGNTSQFILLALVAAMLLMRSGQLVTAGALLAALTILKPALGLFGFFFLFRRDWRGLAGYAATGIVISLASLAIYGWQFNRFWFETSILQIGHQWFAAFSVQSVPGFLLRLRPDWGLATSWVPVAGSALEQRISQLAMLAMYAVAALACLVARRHPPAQDGSGAALRRDLQFMLVLCLALVASPLSWSHYYCWLLIPAAFFLGDRAPIARMPRAVGWTAIASVTPLVIWPHDFGHGLFGTIYRTLVLSNLLLGGLLWLGLVAWWLATPVATKTPRLSQALP
jgi:alpha-1,2-mannosyltransferase